MSISFLLPHAFKKIGNYCFPVGLLVWIAVQRGVATRLALWIYPDSGPLPANPIAAYHKLNVVLLAVSFLATILGLYFISFSKEKKEDEFVIKTRLESFLFAALVQVILIVGFMSSAVFVWQAEWGDFLQEAFPLLLVLVFWLTYIIRFHYCLHWKFYRAK